jgi:orotate phosphoribosyltransferase
MAPTAQAVAEALRADVVGVVTVIDREEGAGDAFAAAGLTLMPILTLTDFK